MKSSVLAILVALNLVIQVKSLAPQLPPEHNAQVSTGTGKTPVTFDDIVPLSDENDSSRRLFMTSLVGLSLLAGVQEAEAITTIPTNEASKQSSVSGSSTVTSDAAAATVDWKGILQKSSKRALGGGKAGASAAVVQVLSLMWLRTSMNYQVS